MNKILGIIASLAMLALVGCGGPSVINEHPAATRGDYSGKDFSGSVAVFRAAGDIPYVPASRGKRARWSYVERAQVLYFDGDCQVQLFHQLPGWAQAIAKEGGWMALAVAVGEAGFAAAFPGADHVRYFLGGLGYGFPAGMNTGRYRQDSSEKATQSDCVKFQVNYAHKKYQVLEGIGIGTWYGNGQTTLPPPADSRYAPTLPFVPSDDNASSPPPN